MTSGVFFCATGWHKMRFTFIMVVMSSQFLFGVQVCFLVLLSGWLWLAISQRALTAAPAPAGQPPRRNKSRSQFSTEGSGWKPASYLAFSPTAGNNLKIQGHGVQQRRRQFENRHQHINLRAVVCFIARLGEAAYRT